MILAIARALTQRPGACAGRTKFEKLTARPRAGAEKGQADLFTCDRPANLLSYHFASMAGAISGTPSNLTQLSQLERQEG